MRPFPKNTVLYKLLIFRKLTESRGRPCIVSLNSAPNDQSQVTKSCKDNTGNTKDVLQSSHVLISAKEVLHEKTIAEFSRSSLSGYKRTRLAQLIATTSTRPFQNLNLDFFCSYDGLPKIKCKSPANDLRRPAINSHCLKYRMLQK